MSGSLQPQATNSADVPLHNHKRRNEDLNEGAQGLQVSYKVPSKHTWPLYGGPPDKGLRANTGKVNIATLKTNSSLLPLSLKKLSSLHYSRIRFNPKCRWLFSKSDIRIATLTWWPRLSFSLSRPHRLSGQGSKTLVNHVVKRDSFVLRGLRHRN